MRKNKDKLSCEDNQFLDRLADRSLPEPDQASSNAILSHAASRITENLSENYRKSSCGQRQIERKSGFRTGSKATQRPPTARRPHYQQLAAGIIAASVVLILSGVYWYSSMFEKDQNVQPAPQNQIANNQTANDQTEELQPIDHEAIAAAEALDPMAFDDTYGQLAVSSTKQRIGSFWSCDASWQQSRSIPMVDQRLSTVRYRIEQLKKRSEFNELFKSEPTKDEGGQLQRLEASRHVCDVFQRLSDDV